MSHPLPSSAAIESPPETLSGLVISLAFWSCLLFASCLFGIVALSPKFLTYLQLRNQFDANQQRLVSLEKQAGKLQRVIDAIHTDKEFSAELTRIELDAVRPGEEVLPVDSALELDHRDLADTTSESGPLKRNYEPFVQMVSSDEHLRMTLLAVSALIIVFAFTSLQPSAVDGSRAPQDQKSLWRSLRNRYIRSA